MLSLAQQPDKTEPQNILRFSVRQPGFSLPTDPSNEELAFDWTLSDADKKLVLKRRGDDNRRRYAIQLCVVRKYSRFLSDFSSVSTKIIGYISSQLEINPVLFLTNIEREMTDEEYRKDIQEYMGLIPFTDDTIDALEAWILQIVRADFYVEDLIQRAETFLRQNKIIFPASKQLERMVNSAYAKAEKRIFELIAMKIPDAIRNSIDKILEIGPDRNKSDFFAFDDYPPEAKAKALSEQLDKYNELVSIGIDTVCFQDIPPALLNELGKAVKCYDAWQIKRFEESKRYALAACYLHELRKTILDNIVYMNSKYLTNIHREAKNAFEKEHGALRKRLQKGIETLKELGKKVLSLGTDQTIGPVFQVISRPAIEDAITVSEDFTRLEERGYLEKLQGKYRSFRKFFPKFLQLNFLAEHGGEYLIQAITIARQLDSGELKTIPGDCPTQFVPVSWMKMLKLNDGTIDRKTWELSLAIAMKEALKTGVLYLPDSRGYKSFWELVYNDEKWATEKQQAYTKLGFPPDAEKFVERLTSEFNQVAAATCNGIHNNPYVKIMKEHISFKKEEALPVSPETEKLRELIASQIPKVRIEKLLKEVNALCSFVDAIRPVDGSTSRTDNYLPSLYASLIAHGTNLGIYAMANSNDKITVSMLQRATKACFREDTLKASNTILVNYQNSLESTAAWGDGHSSSSDGQRFGVNHSMLNASFYPRYFGYYDKIITVYTHVSDQCTVFSTKVISCGLREALYVLDGLLDNISDLTPIEHHTDTHGYTDHIFALCYLLGFSFMPRLTALHKRSLYKIDKNKTYGILESLFEGTGQHGNYQRAMG